MSRKAGPKLALNNKKLKMLFAIMQISPFDKFIAMQLGLSKAQTITQWVRNGEALMEQFEDKLQELDDIFIFEYNEVFNNRILEFDAEFRRLYDLEPEGGIPDRLRVTYDNYIRNERNKFIENNVERKENEILDDVVLSENEDLDKEFKLYIKFARIYKRGRNIKELGYLQNIDKHASSSKNVGLSLKMLEKLDKENFAETQVVTHTGNIDINSKSILALALQHEKQQKEAQLALEKNDENILDANTLNLIEQKQD